MDVEDAGRTGVDNDDRKDGNVKPTMYDVARKARVSFVSVSRVYNDHPNVSDELRRRVFDAARELGYQPKLISRPDVVGLVIRDKKDFRFGTDLGLLSGHLHRFAQEHGIMTRIVPYEQLHQLIRHGLKGIVELGLQKNPLDGREEIPNIPVVLTQLRSDSPHWASVTIDYHHEADGALTAMVNKGYRRIAVLLSERPCWTSQERIKALNITARKLGLDSEYPLVCCTCDGSHADLEQKLKSEGIECLVNFDTDRLACLLDHFFNESDLRIPGDLAILTADNTGLCAHYHPRVSYIRQPLMKIAGKAIEFLRNGAQVPDMNRNLKFNSTLHLLDTTPGRP